MNIVVRKFEIHNEPKTPDKKTIEKYKDFNRLKANYDQFAKRPKKPLYKDPKAFLVLVIIALLAWLLIEVFAEEKKEMPSNQLEKTEKRII